MSLNTKPELTKAVLQQAQQSSSERSGRADRADRAGRSENSLDHLISKIKQFEYLDKQLKLDLPSFLKPHCKIANFNTDQGKISLVVSSSSMAAKWHYLKPGLLIKLRANPVFSGVSQIDIQIDPNLFLNHKNINHKNIINNKSKKFSPESSQVLKQTIQACQDEKIRKQLEKLLKYTS